MPQLDPASRYRDIGTVRVLALVFTVLAGTLNILFNMVGPEAAVELSGPAAVPLFIGSGVVVVGMVFGILAIFTQPRYRALGSAPPTGIFGGMDTQVLFMMLSPLMMIAGTAIKLQKLQVGAFQLQDIGLGFFFGFCFLLYVEYLTAVRRFMLIGNMAIQRNLQDFDFRHVINHYISLGLLLAGIIALISLGVIGIHLLFTANVLPPQLALSVEIQSVYGIAVVEAIVFTLAAMVVSLTFGGREYVATVRAISSFSRERLGEMGGGPQGAPGPNYGPLPGGPQPRAGAMAGQPPR